MSAKIRSVTFGCFGELFSSASPCLRCHCFVNFCRQLLFLSAEIKVFTAELQESQPEVLGIHNSDTKCKKKGKSRGKHEKETSKDGFSVLTHEENIKKTRCPSLLAVIRRQAMTNADSNKHGVWPEPPV